jgi:hypothetical protein
MKRSNMPREQKCFFLVVILIISILTFNSTFASLETSIFATRQLFGIPIEKWAQEYWQYWAKVPSKVLDDARGRNDACIIGSDPSKRVFYLADSYADKVELNCTVPANAYFLIPLLIGECDPTVPDLKDNPKLVDFWECAANADEPLVSARIIVDGKTLFEKAGDRVTNSTLLDDALVRNSALFNITIPIDSQFEVDKPGTYPAVVDGHYIFLKPLSPGNHVIEYQFEHGGSDKAGITSTLGNTHYTLVVK